VIRRILRRAIRYGFSFLGFRKPFIFELVPDLINSLGEAFPELENQKGLITQVIKQEEESFLRTLDNGIELLQVQLKSMSKGDTLSGKTVFELYDTFGFPFDLTSLMASESGMLVDEAGFKSELNDQKSRSRKDGKVSTKDWIEVNPSTSSTEFIGYDHTSCDCKILRYREVESKNKIYFQVVLDRTPFYPEGGGQVGDSGFLISKIDKNTVTDTKKENQLIIHTLTELPKDPSIPFFSRSKF